MLLTDRASRICLIAAIASLLLMTSASVALAQDLNSIPSRFYGSVYLNGAPAPPGTIVQASAYGAELGSAVTDTPGRYILDVPAPANGASLTFTVNEMTAALNVAWEKGRFIELPLHAATTVAPAATSTPALSRSSSRGLKVHRGNPEAPDRRDHRGNPEIPGRRGIRDCRG